MSNLNESKKSTEGKKTNQKENSWRKGRVTMILVKKIEEEVYSAGVF